MVNPRVFFDVTVDNKPLGRIIFELFADFTPKTCENFRALCTGEKGVSPLSEYPLYYKNSIMHRCIKDFMIQGGDFTKRNGTGGESIYGGTFPDEDLSRALDSEGLLCMANKGPNTNGSQFFITLRACPHLNGKHVVFGRVIRGYEEVVKAIEKVPTDQKDRPSVPVAIANCGELVLKSKAAPAKKEVEKESVSESESDSEEANQRHRHKKRRHRHRSDDEEEDSEDEDREKKRKHHKKSKHRHRSPSPSEQDGDKEKSKEDDTKDLKDVNPDEETEEQYDARLEREEKERIEAARKKELERLKELETVASAGGVRFKGRGRMKYVDPELHRDSYRDYRY